MNLVLEDGDRCRWISVHTEIVRTSNRHVAVVATVEIEYVSSTFHPPGIARYRDHILEDHILGQEVEEVITGSESSEPFTNQVEEGPVGSKFELSSTYLTT